MEYVWGFSPFKNGLRSIESQVPGLPHSVSMQGQKNVFFNMRIHVRHWQEKEPHFFSPPLLISMPWPLPNKKHMKEAMQQQKILTFQALASHMLSTRLNYTLKMHYRCS